MLLLDPCSLTLVLRARVTRVNVTGQLSIGDGLLDLDDFAFTNLGATSVTGTYTMEPVPSGSYDSTTLGSIPRKLLREHHSQLAGHLW